jgi:predicted ester cyclase
MLTINGVSVGRETVKENMRRRFAAFPDLHVTIEEMIGEADKVGIWYKADGTHKGEFEKIPATETSELVWIRSVTRRERQDHSSPIYR